MTFTQRLFALLGMLAVVAGAFSSPSRLLAFDTWDEDQAVAQAPYLPDDPQFACELQDGDLVGATRSGQERIKPAATSLTEAPRATPAPLRHPAAACVITADHRPDHALGEHGRYALRL